MLFFEIIFYFLDKSLYKIIWLSYLTLNYVRRCWYRTNKSVHYLVFIHVFELILLIKVQQKSSRSSHILSMSIALNLKLSWSIWLRRSFLQWNLFFFSHYKGRSSNILCFFIGKRFSYKKIHSKYHKSKDREDHEDDMRNEITICYGCCCWSLTIFWCKYKCYYQHSWYKQS